MCHLDLVLQSPAQDDLAASWNLAEGSGEDDISELCGLWNMGPAETPSRGLTLSLSNPLSLSLSLSVFLLIGGSDKRLAELNMALEDKRRTRFFSNQSALLWS